MAAKTLDVRDRAPVPSRLLRGAFRGPPEDDEVQWAARISYLRRCASVRAARYMRTVAAPLTLVLGDWAGTLPSTSHTARHLTQDKRRVLCAWWRALHTFGGPAHPATAADVCSPCGVAKHAFDHLRGTRAWHEAVAAALALPSGRVSCPSPRPALRVMDAALADGRACHRRTIPVLLLVWAMLQLIAGSAHRLWVAEGRPRISRRMSTRVRTFGPMAALALRDTGKARCDVCDDGDAQLRRCAACGMGAYCSRTCQKRAWRKGHRHACLLWRAAMGKNGRVRDAALRDMHA